MPRHWTVAHVTRNLIVVNKVFSGPKKNSLNIKFLGRMFLGHPGPRRRDIPDKNFMQVAFFCCFRQGVAGMSRDLGRDVPDLEKLYARKLWADLKFSYPKLRDPPGLKILRRANFGTGRKFGTDITKRYGEGSEMSVFLGENGTDNEKLRRKQNTTDSSAVPFLVRKGPLGYAP